MKSNSFQASILIKSKNTKQNLNPGMISLRYKSANSENLKDSFLFLFDLNQKLKNPQARMDLA